MYICTLLSADDTTWPRTTFWFICY
jgi:hypothetical protein